MKKTMTTLLLGFLVVALLPALCAGQMGERLVSVDATQTPIVDVLRVLADKSGLNIVTSPDVEGREISIRLSNTPIDEALNLVVRAAGLGYERIGNSILVADAKDLETETGFATYIIDLEHADAAEVAPLLEDIVEAVAPAPDGAKLIVVATPGMVDQIEQIVAELDVPPIQIMLETEVIEVSTDDLAEFGIDWEQITKQTVIFAEGTPEPSDVDELPDDMPYNGRGLDFDGVSRQMQTLEVALDFLQGEGKAKLLSHAKLATVNNKSAEIHIGDVIPYTVTGYSQSGAYDVQVEKEKVGVTVDVTPRVSGGGYITTLVEPNVSSIVGFKGPNDEIPWTKERTAKTQVRVKDGETFMIAGLLSEDETETVSKVPFLGDIPVLGYLFKHIRHEVKHSDLIIKITPKILS